MYQPKFNSVLVEIDDKDAEWGGESNEAMLGKSYSKGKFISHGEIMHTPDHPTNIDKEDIHLLKLLPGLTSKNIMWNEGAEAGTTFEEDGKLYGMIYWWDIRGARE